MTWSFDERTLLVVVVALVGSLMLLMTALRGQTASGAYHPSPKRTPSCPGDPYCPGPTWHILFDIGLPPAQPGSSSFSMGGGGGGGRPADDALAAGHNSSNFTRRKRRFDRG